MPIDNHPEFTKVFARTCLAELEYLQRRRDALAIPHGEIAAEIGRLRAQLDSLETARDPDHREFNKSEGRPSIRPSSSANLVGIAFSGGGIRSATFNLGVLQGLAEKGILRFCDYLSTVSGGGYIGSCLSSVLDNPAASPERDRFPFLPRAETKFDEKKEVKWLRQHSNYLAVDTSFFGWDIWRMIGMYLSGLVLTNLVPFALLLLIAYLGHTLESGFADALIIARLVLVGSLSCFIAMVLARIAMARLTLQLQQRKQHEYVQAGLAATGVFFAVVAGMMLLTHYLPQFQARISTWLHGSAVVSAVALLAGLVRSENKWLRSFFWFVFRSAWVVLVPVVFVELLYWLREINAFSETAFFTWRIGIPLPLVLAGLLLVLSLLIDTNRITLHHFYRDRLSETYVIKRDAATDQIISNENLELSSLHEHANGAPYQLINATLNVPASEDRYLRGRGADFFTLSKHFCGAESTGFRRTEVYEPTRLATALAISGAAASPQSGTSTSRVVMFIMTLLNISLNRWMRNPERRATPKLIFWPYYFVKELLGACHESDALINLSDGGHIENLGAYQLIKRGCRFVIVFDAGADPEFFMEDFGNLLQKVRVDLGVEVEINLERLRLQGHNRNSLSQWAAGTISYPGDKQGVLIYVKASMTGQEPEDLLAYRRQNPHFPHEATVDQFFDESQFESYRKLGQYVARVAFAEEHIRGDAMTIDDVMELFDEIHDRYYRMLGSADFQEATPGLASGHDHRDRRPD